MHEPAQDRSTASPVGQHLLGPHVVGQRVVVRRLVPGETGPTGGPAFTDALGTCTGWYDDHLALLREDGEEDRIPLALVVSGKPVPPRPAVRGRVSPEEAQRRSGVGGTPDEEGDLLFLLAGVAGARRRLPRGLVDAAAVPTGPGTVRVELAGGRCGASYAQDWVGVHDLEVDADRRRQRLGLALVAEALAWGAEQGATTAWAVVPVGDDAALRLAEGLGAAVHHRFRSSA